MRIVKTYEMTKEDEEIALECMIRRRNRESQERYSDKIENDIKILNKHKLFQSAIGLFVVDFAELIHGHRYEYITRIRIRTRGKNKL